MHKNLENIQCLDIYHSVIFVQVTCFDYSCHQYYAYQKYTGIQLGNTGRKGTVVKITLTKMRRSTA